MTTTFRILAPSHAALFMRHLMVYDPTLLNFENASCIEMGEFVTTNSAEQAVRAANPGVPPGPYVVYAEKGRSDTQSLAEPGLPVIFLGGYMAETKIFNSTVAPVLGAALEVANVTYGTKTVSGLQTHAGGANPVIGYVIKTAAANNGWLKFQQVLV